MRHILLLTIIFFSAIYSSAQEQMNYPIDTINGVPCYRYTPEKSIGIYRISKRFGISQEEIIDFNPQLALRGPKVDEILYIPVKQKDGKNTKHLSFTDEQAHNDTPAEALKDSAQALAEQDPVQKDTLPADWLYELFHNTGFGTPQSNNNNNADNRAKLIDQPHYNLTQSDTLRLAVVLPFNSQAVQRSAIDDRFLDYYMGVLLAIHRAQQSGQKMEVHTYDIDRQDTVMSSVLQDPFVATANAIIGPAYTAQVNVMARFAKQHAIWLLVPFISDVEDIDNNPYILQFNPTSEIEAQALAQYIADLENPLQCIFIDAKDTDIPHSIRLLRKHLTERNVPVRYTTLHQVLTDSMEYVLRDSIDNIFLFNTERYGNMQVLMPHLTYANQRYLVTLITQYSWQKENIPLSRIYSSTFACEYNDKADSTAYANDRAYYCRYKPVSDLPRYDILGYDQTCHLIRMLQQMQDVADPNYVETVLTRQYKGLQSNIQYHKVSEKGGYINQDIHIHTR